MISKTKGKSSKYYDHVSKVTVADDIKIYGGGGASWEYFHTHAHMRSAEINGIEES